MENVLYAGTNVIWGKVGEPTSEGVLVGHVDKCCPSKRGGNNTFFAWHHVGIPVDTVDGRRYAHWVERKEMELVK